MFENWSHVEPTLLIDLYRRMFLSRFFEETMYYSVLARQNTGYAAPIPGTGSSLCGSLLCLE